MSLPSGYKRLEYIQSSGTQYVDTGFQPNQDTRVFCDAVFVASSTAYWLFGARNGTQDRTFGFLTYSNQYRSDYNTSPNEYLTGVQSGRFTVDKDGNVTKINGETAKTATAGTFQCTHNLYLLANNNNGTVGGQCSATLYACQIYDNGTIVRDYIPCQTTAGEVGLWDDVNSVFYGNAGTGTFTAGPVIAIAIDESEITKLEYIQSSGTQYVDTWFQPNQDTTVEVTFETTQSNQCGVAATDQAWQSNGFGIWANCVAYGSQTDQTVVFYGIGKVTARLDRNKLYKNGELIWTASAATFSCPSNLTLMALNRNGTIQEKTAGNLYSSKIYDNGTIIRDYIAAKMPDGTVGLYDKLHGLLYINVGSGAFTAGPEVPKAPPTPTGFAAAFLTETTVQLSWSASDEATGYKLYKNGDLLSTLTDTSYTDTVQIFSGTVYAVTAYNDNGESESATLTYYAASENPILYLVTDRTAEDVASQNVKGTYRSGDLNRVGFAVQYLSDYLYRHGITASVSPKLHWTDTDHPTPSEMRIYLNDISTLRAALKLPKDTATVPEDMVNLTYQEANDIESILMALDDLLGKMLSIVDAGWTGGMAYTGFYFKEATV